MHANGHLWQVNHYIDDQEVLPTECWYYSHSEYAYNDPDGVAEAPTGMSINIRHQKGLPFITFKKFMHWRTAKSIF